MAGLPSGTVTLLFTDIEGSTRLLQALGREAYMRALSEQRRLLREAFSRHGGVEVEMQGDSFHFAFSQATEAVLAAAEAQQALADHAWEAEPIKVRIGIHTGEPVSHEGLYAGLDVHRAARVMQAGHGGQVLLSETTRALVEGLPIRELGLHRLKDLTQPQRLYQLGDGDFPRLKTLEATNLPLTSGPLLGRERELQELTELLSDGSRLVTLTGPGGTGKTRLALQVAAELVGRVRDGVCWVPLAGLSDPELVLPAIAQRLGAQDDVHAYLRDKELLLLLDNAEHLLQASPRLGELGAASPGLRMLVTSRAPLRLRGEREYSLEPLPETDAVTLFVERSRGVGCDLDPDETVAAICRRLDGLPLALELAAARTKLVGPKTMLARLEHALPILTGGARDAPERQRTLRATIQWSYDLLDEPAKNLFQLLAVFAGSFSLEAAEQVCGADLDSLAALADLNLLKPIGEGRFLMLATIREYAQELLGSSGGDEQVRDAHAAWYLELAEAIEPELRGGKNRVAGLRLIDSDLNNVRAALSWFEETGATERALRLSTALWRFWLARGPFGEGRRGIERALERAEAVAAPLHARALEGLSVLAALQGDLGAARGLSEESLALFRAIGDHRGIAETLNNLGVWAHAQGDDVRAKELFEQSRAVAQAAGDLLVEALVLGNLADTALGEGQYADAVELSGQQGAIYKRLGDEGRFAFSLVTLGSALAEQGVRERAASALRSAIAAWEAIPQREYVAIVFTWLARIAASDGDLDRAARLLGAADDLLKAVGGSWDWMTGGDRSAHSATLTILRQQLSQEELEEADAAGRSMTIAEAVAYALEHE